MNYYGHLMGVTKFVKVHRGGGGVVKMFWDILP